MVKKIKRFIIFCLFSFFFSLLSGKIEKKNNETKNKTTWNSADAGMCCEKGTVGATKDGKECCPCTDDGPYCYCG